MRDSQDYDGQGSSNPFPTDHVQGDRGVGVGVVFRSVPLWIGFDGSREFPPPNTRSRVRVSFKSASSRSNK